MNAERIKKSGFFAPGDLLVYGLLAVLVAVLFLITAFGGRGAAAGIEITLAGERVYVYEFGTGGKITRGKEALVSERTEGNAVTVTVFTDEEKENYNTVIIDRAEKTACVYAANCSFSRDCTHMPSITSSSGVIVCVPHALVVRALGEKEEFRPSVG